MNQQSSNAPTIAENRYLAGLHSVNSLAYVVIALCVLSPIVLAFASASPALVVTPFIAISLVGMAMPFTALRWFGPTMFGGPSAAAIVPLLAALLACLLLGTIVVLVLNPAGAPYLMLPGVVLIVCMVMMLDLVLRGFFHAWMHHVGFGPAFRLIVPAVLVALLALPVGIVREPLLPLCLVAGSVFGGVLRHHYTGMAWMIASPMMLLITMFLATW
jgi:hypothetical protein